MHILLPQTNEFSGQPVAKHDGGISGVLSYKNLLPDLILVIGNDLKDGAYRVFFCLIKDLISATQKKIRREAIDISLALYIGLLSLIIFQNYVFDSHEIPPVDTLLFRQVNFRYVDFDSLESEDLLCDLVTTRVDIKSSGVLYNVRTINRVIVYF